MRIAIAMVLLSGALAGCGGKEGRTPEAKSSARPSVSAPSAKPRPAFDPRTVRLQSPADVLPAAFSGWKMAAAPRYFDRDSVYELINGAADGFLRYGLVKLAAVDYRSDADPDVSLSVEVYDMGDAKGALGRMARDRRALGGAVRADGWPAALAGRVVPGVGDGWLRAGRYLVHAVVVDSGADASPQKVQRLGNAAIPALFSAVDAAVGPVVVPGLTAFPAEHRVDHTAGWEPEPDNALGVPCAALFARYRSGAAQWTAFVCDGEDADAAKRVREAKGKMRLVGRRLVGVMPQPGGALPQEAQGTLDALAVWMERTAASLDTRKGE